MAADGRPRKPPTRGRDLLLFQFRIAVGEDAPCRVEAAVGSLVVRLRRLWACVSLRFGS